MECMDYQRLINRLHDGELPSEDSGRVFLHLSACAECRDFYSGLRILDSAMNRLADHLPSEDELRSTPPPIAFQPRHLWNRQVSLRLPVLALLLCAIAVSLFMLIPGTSLFRSPESIYVTRLPAVVIEASAAPSQPIH